MLTAKAQGSDIKLGEEVGADEYVTKPFDMEEVFEKIAAMTASGGKFVTYSCKGSVKRALKASGFAVEKIAGPPGKREMIRGIRQ